MDRKRWRGGSRAVNAALHAVRMGPAITGTDRLARNVLAELQQLDAVNAYSVRCAPGDSYVASVVEAPNFRVFRARGRRWEEHVALPLRLRSTPRRRRPDVFLSFRNLHVPGVRPPRVVATVLDVAPVLTSYHHPSAARRALRRRLVERSVVHADHFVAISAFTKGELVERFGVDPGAVSVAPLAAEARFAPVDDETAAAVHARYGLPQRFVLAAGGGDPRKNVATAIEAHAGLKGDVPLVVLGGSWHGRELTAPGNVRSLGQVPDDDLPALYALADVFVFLSLYEGFGLPPLEAMACGTAVVCSDTTSMPEVAGDAAVLVDPSDPDHVATELEALLEDDTRRAQLETQGLARAATFSWRETAETFHRVLNAVSD